MLLCDRIRAQTGPKRIDRLKHPRAVPSRDSQAGPPSPNRPLRKYVEQAFQPVGRFWRAENERLEGRSHSQIWFFDGPLRPP